MRLRKIVVLIFTLAGFSLRLYYAVNTHPFFDEYTTVLAARQILRQGWPILPSGLFYEHGLLATYLIAPFTALFINMPLSEWQPAHWGLMLARWPSVMLGTVTVPLIYVLGRQGFKAWTARSPFSTPLAILAAGLFALSPEGMVWGGRARMYALATMLVLLTVYWAYQGSIYPAPATYRRRALLTLLAALLTQFGTMLLIPPLLMAMLIIGWLSWRETKQTHPNTHPSTQSTHTLLASRFPLPAPRSPLPAPRPWFLRPTVLLEGAVLAAIIGLAIFIKRLGRPLGAATLAGSPDGDNLLVDIFDKTVAYQTTFHFTWPDTVTFLARQFGVPHHFWLTLITLMGTAVGLIYWLIGRFRNEKAANQSELWPVPLFSLFLWLVFGGMIGLMVTLLEPFRRNPRYLVMYLPLFYLIAANAIFNFRFALPLTSSVISRIRRSPLPALRSPLSAPRFPLPILLSLILLIILALIGFNDWRIALLTPEPAYETAFAQIRTEWQPGDALLTMNTPAAGLYFGRADGFTVQLDADQFLLDAETAPIDRWLGVPWIGRADDFNTVLNSNRRTWFVIDTIRQPVYFKGNWLAIVNSQMEQVWAQDNALIYRTRPDRVPIPAKPDRLVNATLGDSIQLVGYALDGPNTQAQTSSLTSTVSDFEADVSSSMSGETKLQLTLFWQPLQPLATDYTTFLHLRDEAGVTVAQRDRQPLDGAYPTSQWQPGETVIDPITFVLPEDLSAGSYTLYTGLYRLDTLERLPVANDSTGENAILLGEIVLP